jgi:hypothetical protein
MSSATSLEAFQKRVAASWRQIVHALHALQMSASESGALAAGLRCGDRVGNHRLERPALLLPNLSSSLNGSPCGIRAASSDEEDRLRTRPNRWCRHESRCLIWSKPLQFIRVDFQPFKAFDTFVLSSAFTSISWLAQTTPASLPSWQHFGFWRLRFERQMRGIRVRTRSDRSNTRLQS